MRTYCPWILTSLIAFALCTEASAAPQGENKIPKLTVSGNATLQKPADQMTLSIGVVTENADAKAALKDNSKKMQAVLSALEEIGMERTDYHTGRFTIRPVYTQRPRNAPEDWRTKIQGYEVTNTVNIKTDKLHLAGDIIDAVNRAGANSIDNIRFGLKDTRLYRTEAIAAASKNALDDAKTLADSVGLKLVRVLYVNLDHAHAEKPLAKAQGLSYTRMSEFTPPIEAGDVDVHAEVTVVYEVAPK